MFRGEVHPHTPDVSPLLFLADTVYLTKFQSYTGENNEKEVTENNRIQ